MLDRLTESKPLSVALNSALFFGTLILVLDEGPPQDGYVLLLLLMLAVPILNIRRTLRGETPQLRQRVVDPLEIELTDRLLDDQAARALELERRLDTLERRHALEADPEPLALPRSSS